MDADFDVDDSCADASSSLDPPEFAGSEPRAPSSRVDAGELPSLPEPFKHSGWKRYRQQIWRALNTADVGSSRLRAFSRCGAQVWILSHKTDPDRFKIVLGTCHDRFCQPCARMRAANIRANLEHYLTTEQLRFVTLTLAHADVPLDGQVARLYRAFKDLRATAWWRDRVDGGAAFLEVTRNAATGRWHPHFHVLVAGRYLPQHQLSQLWFEATGDSCVVDVRAVTDRSMVAKYVTKYVTKPLSSNVFSDLAVLVEVVQALEGRRMLVTFGAWRKWHLTASPSTDEWALYAHESQVWQRLNDGDEFARIIADAVLEFLYAEGDNDVTLRRPKRVERPPPPTEAQLYPVFGPP